MTRIDAPPHRLADRIARLGTETAFAVSAETAAHAAAGHKVYPFHIGDINLPTPPNIVEATLRALRDGKTGYCPPAGIAPLREALAADVNRARGTDYTADDVAVQPGGKPVIGKFFMALMNSGDEVLYPNPGYPIYESQIEFHGGRAVPYTFRPGERSFRLDGEALRALVTPRTRLLVFNNLHNPTGAESTREELEMVADLARRHDLFVLCDEAYFDIRYEGRSESLASLPGMRERCLILYTFAKKFAMAGWRLGAAVGPRWLVDVIAKLNVNDESCTNHFTQYGALEALTGDPSGPAAILRTLKERRDRALEIVQGIRGVHCYVPQATFYLYPDVTDAMAARGLDDYEAFRRAALQDTGVSFCTRIHFGRPLAGETRRSIRLAYSGIDADAIEEGLGRFKHFVEG